MKVRTTQLGVAVYLAPDSALTADNVEGLGESVRAAGGDGPTNIVLDLKNVPLIDSMGLEFLLDLAHRLREGGGSLRLANVNSLCREALAITELDQVIPVYEDLDGAGRSFL
ncbi:MAG: STAS domain-containing protein [Candidatus Eisenbacteria bacterium]